LPQVREAGIFDPFILGERVVERLAVSNEIKLHGEILGKYRLEKRQNAGKRSKLMIADSEDSATRLKRRDLEFINAS
jgi:hypothetical protein